jgi:hypothetical protein
LRTELELYQRLRHVRKWVVFYLIFTGFFFTCISIVILIEILNTPYIPPTPLPLREQYRIFAWSNFVIHGTKKRGQKERLICVKNFFFIPWFFVKLSKFNFSDIFGALYFSQKTKDWAYCLYSTGTRRSVEILRKIRFCHLPRNKDWQFPFFRTFCMWLFLNVNFWANCGQKALR